MLAVGTRIRLSEKRCREIIDEVSANCTDITKYHLT
jgi:hypothetical protein